MYNGTGTPTISSSSFLTNSVTTDAGRGGGLYNESADLTIEGLTFQGNSAVGYFHSPTNWAAGFGGGLYNGSGTLVIRGNTFQGNWASGYHMGPPDPDNPHVFSGPGGQGGGVYNKSGSLTFDGNTFTGNTVSSVSRSEANDSTTFCTTLFLWRRHPQRIRQSGGSEQRLHGQ